MKILAMALLALLAQAGWGAEVPSQAEPAEECDPFGPMGTGIRYDCGQEWKIYYRLGHKVSGDRVLIFVDGSPLGEITMWCRYWPGRKAPNLYIDFHHQLGVPSPSWEGEKSPFRVGLWEKILPASGEGEYTLKHTVLHYPEATCESLTRASTLQGAEAIDVIRRMYHSESISWTSLLIDRSSTRTTGESSRKALEEFMKFCTISYEPRP